MRLALSVLFICIFSALSFAQNEQSPIVEKQFDYKDWSYKNLNAEGETRLRDFVKGKKLVMVVYWAAWCPNWKHDVAFVQQLHEKYAKDGLAIIGVGEYDTVEKMKYSYASNKLTFPSVYESTSTSQRLDTEHYQQRAAAGDKRKWGSPWYVYLTPDNIEASGDVISKKANVVNGELIRDEAEKFIRTKLGLDGNAEKAEKTTSAIEVCDPAKISTALVNPKP